MGRIFKGRLVELGVEGDEKFSAKFDICDICVVNNNEMYIIFDCEYCSKNCELVNDSKISFETINQSAYNLLSNGFNEKYIIYYDDIDNNGEKRITKVKRV